MNEIILITLYGVIIAQWLKVPIYYYKTKEWDWSIALSTGSMPSSHTACVVTLTSMVGLVEGFDSAVFAVATVFTLITLHDAVKVRGESGKQAIIINELVSTIHEFNTLLDIKVDLPEKEKKLKELIGHNSVEVFAGTALGIAVVIIFNFLINL
ncbi:MAG: divergent PAP2 family protein [Mycoplasmatales bacterium]